MSSRFKLAISLHHPTHTTAATKLIAAAVSASSSQGGGYPAGSTLRGRTLARICSR